MMDGFIISLPSCVVYLYEDLCWLLLCSEIYAVNNNWNAIH